LLMAIVQDRQASLQWHAHDKARGGSPPCRSRNGPPLRKPIRSSHKRRNMRTASVEERRRPPSAGFAMRPPIWTRPRWRAKGQMLKRLGVSPQSCNVCDSVTAGLDPTARQSSKPAARVGGLEVKAFIANPQFGSEYSPPAVGIDSPCLGLTGSRRACRPSRPAGLCFVDFIAHGAGCVRRSD
jgi:hypothetical protein